MKSKNSLKIIFTILVAVSALIVFACQSSTADNSNGTTTVKTNSAAPNSAVPNPKPPTMTDYPVGGAQTPSEAYRMLFAAVKSQDPAKIKLMLSKGSMGLAELASSQQKKPIDEVVRNGFSETTFADAMPQMRDERIKGNFAAVEVWNETRKKWDDIPFVLEDGSWKAAFGDQFSGTYQSPGKGQSVIEQEAANAANPAKPLNPLANSNANSNFKSGKRIPKPTKE